MCSQGISSRPGTEARADRVAGSLACSDRINSIALELNRYRFRCGNETELQEAIADALEESGVSFAREVRLDPRNRLDFMAAGGVAIELKVDGSLSDLTRQVHRYLVDDRVLGILIVSTRSNHRRLPLTLRDKPVRVLIVGGL